jgi:hypothetical protein
VDPGILRRKLDLALIESEILGPVSRASVDPGILRRKLELMLHQHE